MDLEFTADQEALRDAVRTLLEHECQPSVLRALVEHDEQPERLWSKQVELGFPAVALPEDLGGLGLGPVETLVLAEEVGRVAAPGPWLATATQYAPIVLACGDERQRTELLAPVAEGAVTGTLAIEGECTARRDGDGWRLSGEKRFVVDAASADEVAVVATVDDGRAAFVVRRTDVGVAPVDVLDKTRPWAHVRFHNVYVESARALPNSDGIDRAVQTATMALAAEIVGVCTRLLEMTVAYAQVREQFGQPIGSFQAIKHKLADCFVELERARACVYFAAATLAEDDPRRAVAVAMAKAAANDCSVRLVREALQTHGGIGYTWEHDLHFFLKRAKADAVLFGSAAAHRQKVAAEVGLSA